MLRFAQMQLYKPKITNNCNFFEYYLFFVFFAQMEPMQQNLIVYYKM